MTWQWVVLILGLVWAFVAWVAVLMHKPNERAK